MPLRKLFVPILIVLGAILLFVFPLLHFYDYNCPLCAGHNPFSVTVIQLYVLHFEFWAMLFYVFLYTLNTISVVPPILPLSLAAGIIFGPEKGTLALSLGILIGTSATFCISRVFEEKYVEQLIKGKMKEWEKKLDEKGFWVMLFLRLFPILPYEMINYTAGLSTMRYRDYIWGTMIGIFPSVIGRTYFAGWLIEHWNVHDPAFFISAVALLLICLLPALYVFFVKRGKVKPVNGE